MDSTIITLISQGGLIVIGAVLVVYIMREHKKLQGYIMSKLSDIVQNNTKALQELILVINELRHEIKERFDRLEEKIEKKS
jgi:hypothetical protein